MINVACRKIDKTAQIGNRRPHRTNLLVDAVSERDRRRLVDHAERVQLGRLDRRLHGASLGVREEVGNLQVVWSLGIVAC